MEKGEDVIAIMDTGLYKGRFAETCIVLTNKRVMVYKRGKSLEVVSLAHIDELEKVLEVIYHIPKVKRIAKIDHEEQRYICKVKLEDGKDLEIVTWSRCVRIMPDGRIFIKDVNGHYYEVRSLDSLDIKSKILLGTMI